jgi:hypothetical protein
MTLMGDGKKSKVFGRAADDSAASRYRQNKQIGNLLEASLNTSAVVVFGSYIAQESANMKIGRAASTVNSDHAGESGHQVSSTRSGLGRFDSKVG